MKKITLATLLIAGSMVAIGQSSYRTVEFKTTPRPALILQLTFSPETAEQTILAKLKETGYRPEKSGGFLNKRNKEDGFYKFAGVVLPALANQKVDLYFRVDPVSNDSGHRSSITLLVSQGYENFVSSGTDSATFIASEKFLNGFVQNTNVFNINQQLDDLKKKLTAAEKKRSQLRENQKDAKEKIARLESDTKTWYEEELLQQEEIGKLQSEVRDLEVKLTSSNK